MEKNQLEKAYAAIKTLEALGLPVSDEQQEYITQMEKEYLRDEIIPLISQELTPLVENMRNPFHIGVTYSKNSGLDISLSGTLNQSACSSSSLDEDKYHKKNSILRVTFPDNRVSCHKVVSRTFLDVVKYAGAWNVERLGIMLLGINIVSSKLHENPKYSKYQHEIEPGLYVCTYCNTDRKLFILKTINRELNLNLIIEKVML